MAFSYGLPPRRVFIAALVLLVHAVLIAAFLRMTLSHETPVAPERVYWLSLKAKPPARVRAAPQIVPNIAPMPRPFRLPRFNIPAIPSAPPVPAVPSSETLQGLHQNFFKCALENLAILSPDERAQCTVALKKYDDRSVDYADRTDRSKSAKLWARRLAKKQAPLLLPCMSPLIPSPLYTLYCLGKGVLKGFDLDEMPGYPDVPTTVDHLPNNGDPGSPAAH